MMAVNFCQSICFENIVQNITSFLVALAICEVPYTAILSDGCFVPHILFSNAQPFHHRFLCHFVVAEKRY